MCMCIWFLPSQLDSAECIFCIHLVFLVGNLHIGKCGIYVLLQLFPNISIALEQNCVSKHHSRTHCI